MAEKFFWIDLEMSGLNPDTEVIIEVAALITDLNFNEIDTYETVVRQDQKYIQNMDAWNKKHHGDSGLIEKIPFGKEPTLVENDLIALIKTHFLDPNDKPILCGNSIAQDRLFINKYWPNLNRLLHYRMLDVTSWKIIFQNKFKQEFKKTGKHRALDDIRESINELKFYLNFIKS